jgi:adenylate cyclase
VRRLNRDPWLVSGAQRLRAGLLGGDELAERLSSVRERPVDRAARQLLEVRGEAPGLLGEMGLGALQAWQRLSERQGRGRGEVDVAILFTDLAEFSSWALLAGDEHAVELLRELSEVIEPPMLERGGEIVKRLGDGLMSVFCDAESAVGAALEAHQGARAIERDGYRAVLRTGVHVGRPRRIGGDYLGVDVNIAARISDGAAPDEVLVSERVWRELPDRDAFDGTPRTLSAKGVPLGLRVYAAANAQPPRSRSMRRPGSEG